MAGNSSNLRNWSDTELTRAVAASSSWRGLIRALGLPETSPKMILHIRQDITRLDLSTSHFTVRNTWSEGQLKRAIANAHSWSDLLPALGLQPDSDDGRMRVKANALRLGLDVSRLESGIKRVQVKTTTHNSKNGWMIQVGRRPYSVANNARLVPYDPDLIDWFFVVDGDLSMYLIPSQIIAGRVMILLRTYHKYIVGNAAGLMMPRPDVV